METAYYTSFFCKNGLSHGENLSSILFPLLLNNFGMSIFDDSLQCYLKLMVLLFAYDIVLFAESFEELQNLLDFSHLLFTMET